LFFMAAPSIFVRRHVPNDNECLFTAIAYVAEGSRFNAAGQRLRRVCADKIASDPETYSEAVLGMPNAAYCEWITNPFNWGGEVELGILASHFDLELCVVSMEAFYVLPFPLGTKGRAYLLYTGQQYGSRPSYGPPSLLQPVVVPLPRSRTHSFFRSYDALVGCAHEDAPVAEETRLFPVGSTQWDDLALECARLHARLAAEKAARRVVKRIKCGGCGAILDDSEAFQVPPDALACTRTVTRAHGAHGHTCHGFSFLSLTMRGVQSAALGHPHWSRTIAIGLLIPANPRDFTAAYFSFLFRVGARSSYEVADRGPSRRTAARPSTALHGTYCRKHTPCTLPHQVHCSEVEHDDDFAYDCSEVELVEEGDAAVPDGRIDLSSPDVVTFYNMPSAPFSNLYPAPVDIYGSVWPTAEHAWLSAQFPTLAAAEAIRAAPADALHQLSGTFAADERPGWLAAREACLFEAVRAKFAQHAALRAALLATGAKTLVLADADRWAGMSAVGGIPTGRNHVGECLMRVRAELACASSS
jgi:ribA/ribD-fused uncharacterized protein